MKRTPLTRKTPLTSTTPLTRGSTPLRRTPMPSGSRRRANTSAIPAGFTDDVKARVLHRSGGKCELHAPGCRGRATEFHHRRLRRSGDHRYENCLHLCLACHTWVHDHPAAAKEGGWIVPQWLDPAAVTWRPWGRE